MKKLTLILIALMAALIAGAQVTPGVAINTDGSNAHPSAILDLQSSEQGFLIPRMTFEQRIEISDPAAGLLVYQTTNPAGLYYNHGTPESPMWRQVGQWFLDTLQHNIYTFTQTRIRNQLHVRRDLPTNNVIDDVLWLMRGTTAAPQTDMGTGLLFSNMVSNGAFFNSGRIASILENPISGQAAAGLLFQVRGTGDPNLMNAMYIHSGRNVGIGTREPTEKLDIVGQIRIRGGNPEQNRVLTSTNAEGTATWQEISVLESDPLFISSPASGIGTADIVNWNKAYNWGNHAIAGYAAAAHTHAALDITSGVLNIARIPTGTTGATVALGDHTHTEYIAAETDPTWSGDANTSGSIGRAGNVGIGTTNPSEKLHVLDANFLVQGNFGTGPTLTASGANTRMLFYPRKAAFRMGRVTSDQWNDENVGTYSIAMGYNTVASANFSTAFGYGAKAVSNYSFAIHLSNLSAPEVSANTFQISGATNTIISEGNVGIGTDSPSQKLDINGQIRMRTGAAAGRVLVSDADGTASWIDPAAETDPTWSGNANTTDDIGRTGNVGIGTDSPTAKLHVHGGDAIIHGHTIGRGGGSNLTNFAAGSGALKDNTTGSNNTAIGNNALHRNTTGSYNTVIGSNAGGVYFTNNNCTFIGHDASGNAGRDNAIAIGFMARATSHNQVRLGNDNIQSLYCRGAYWGQVGGEIQRNLYVDNLGKIGYLSSSKRAMENTRDIESVNWLYELRPVSFNFKNDETRNLRYGLIAEEVEKIAPQFVSYNDDGLPETVSYSALITPLLKAVQEQQKIIREQQRQIDALMQRVGMTENQTGF